MLFVQSRYSSSLRGWRTIEYFRDAMIHSIPKKYNPIYDQEGRLESYERDFFEACFDFSTSCRFYGKKPSEELRYSDRDNFCKGLKKNMFIINKQALDWAHNWNNWNGVRKTRSALAFLEKDIISENQALSSSSGWRILKHEGIAAIDEALTSSRALYYDYDEWYFVKKPIDLRGVPRSHNWWTEGSWTFRNSDNEFGESALKESAAPLYPFLEFRNCGYMYVPDLETEVSYFHLIVFKEIFERHLKLRQLELHPVSTFNSNHFTPAKYINAFQRFDQMINYIFDNPNFVIDAEVNPLILRSAIQFMEDDVVPFIKEAKPIWDDFLNSSAMKRLDELLALPWKVPVEYQKLDEIPFNHTWWPEENRRNPGKVADIELAFEAPRERILGYLQLLTEIPDDSPYFPEIIEKFHEYFCDAAIFCQKYHMEWVELLGEPGSEEIRENISTVLHDLHTALKNVKEDSPILFLRRMRSSLEFMKQHELQNKEYQNIMDGSALKNLDNILEKRREEDSESNPGFPESHHWWPIEPAEE